MKVVVSSMTSPEKSHLFISQQILFLLLIQQYRQTSEILWVGFLITMINRSHEFCLFPSACKSYVYMILKSIKYAIACNLREGNGTPLQYSCLEDPMDRGAWWAAVHGVAKSQTRLSDFTFTFHFYALEKEMATHSRVLAWRIPGTGEPGGLLSLGSHRVGHD